MFPNSYYEASITQLLRVGCTLLSPPLSVLR